MKSNPYMTDYVALFKSQFPHIVRINHQHGSLDPHDWLETHVGPRAGDWQHPRDYTYMFRNLDQAAEFALVFS